MNGDNINYMLLNYSVHGIDGMKQPLLHYISCNISYIHINIKYQIFDHSFHCNELFVFEHVIALSRMF
jgi:hypothetical protein